MRTCWTSSVTMAGLAAGFLVAGCASVSTPPTAPAPSTARTVDGHILYNPTTWSGDVRLVRPLLVTRTATLTIRPGTRVFFDIPEPASDAKREPWILVLGALVAMGTQEAPITFTSVDLRNNELDDMIQVREAKEAHIRHAVFERGPWGLHIHDTPTDVYDSVFRNNFGGARFLGDPISLRGNRFEANRIGLRCLSGSPVIEENTFTGNLTGIFFRQGVREAVVRRNNFDNLEYDLKLGEAQTEDVAAAENWWKANENGKLAERIYDGVDAGELGRVHTDPVLAGPWGSEPKKP